ncbi:uncharacterized protein LOC142986517 isoform X2 [Anticarsia gemmatalis]|uniref:uncharacterized protein LOC142986517 isoform X2 n=1 Tax=Anticarsia gemmatalis TaxID=129554 RepID=UPI003F758461
MAVSMHCVRCREKVSIFLVMILLFMSLYFYLSALQHTYYNSNIAGERCTSELTSIKYQLNVVTEYKNRIDHLLSQTVVSQETERQKFKDIMDNCVALKQQTAICQAQFEDLQIECKKVREDYTRLLKQLHRLKSLK